MMFTVKIDARLEANNIHDAFFRLAKHFGKLARKIPYEGTIFQPESKLEIKPEESRDAHTTT